MSKLSSQDLKTIRQQPLEEKSSVSIGMSACGLAAGADEVYRVFVEEIKKRNLPVEINKRGCIGMCYAEPLVEVKVEGLPVITYGRVTPEISLRIIEKHIQGKTLINDYIFESRL